MNAPENVYREMTIYLHANDDTKLIIPVETEWENDLYSPDWGRKGFNLTLKVLFICGRVIIHIVDNDQLADNLLV